MSNVAAYMRSIGLDDPPPECPFRCCGYPLVSLVMNHRRAVSAGLAPQPVTLRAYEAIAFYDRAIESVRAEVERRAIEAERQRNS